MSEILDFSDLLNRPSGDVLDFSDLVEASPGQLGKGRLRSAGASFARSLSEGEADVVKGAVRAASQNWSAFAGPGVPPPSNPVLSQVLRRFAAATPEAKDQAAAAEPLYQGAERFAEASREVYQPNPVHARSFWFGDLPAAVGSTVPGIAAGAVGGVPAGVASYALMSGEQGHREAIEAGRPDAADKAFLAYAAAAGISEAALGVGSRLLQLVRRAREAGVAPDRFSQWARLAGRSAVREALQEGGEQTGQNVAFDQLVADRPWLEGVPKAMALGGIIGGGIGGGAGAVGLLNRPKDPPALPEQQDELPAPAPDAPLDYSPMDFAGRDPDAPMSEREDATPDSLEEAEAPQGAAAATWTATTPLDGAAVAGRWTVVEADSLLTSFDQGFDPALQPRDRSRSASQHQVTRIVSSLEPQRLGESATTDMGAPIVDEQGQVLSGNGRVTALRSLYQAAPVQAVGALQPDRGDVYREWLVRNAERFGINPASFASLRQPVLVRQVTDFGGLSKVEFARQSNQQQVLGMGEAEQAASDARLLRENPVLLDAFRPGEDGNVLAASNREFLGEFIQGTGDQANLLSKDGYNGPALTKRVRNAVLGAVLGPENGKLLSALIEGADTLSMRNVVNAMLQSAPALAKLRGTAYDMGPVLERALSDLVRIRQSGQKVDDYLSQGQLFGDPGRSFETDLMLRFLGNARSAQRITEANLQAVRAAQNAIVDSREGGMFGDAPATLGQIIQRVYAQSTHPGAGVQGRLGQAQEPASESAGGVPQPVDRAGPNPQSGVPNAGSGGAAGQAGQVGAGLTWARGSGGDMRLHGDASPSPSRSQPHKATSQSQPHQPVRADGRASPEPPGEPPRQATPQPDAVNQLIDRLKVDLPPGSMLEGVTGLPVWVWNGSLEVVRAAYNGGKAVAAAIQDGLVWVRERLKNAKFDETGYLDSMYRAMASVRPPLKVVRANPRFNGNPSAARRWALDNLRVGPVVNADSGLAIAITRLGIEKVTSKSALAKSSNPQHHLDAVQVLPEMLANAVVGEVKPDARANKNNIRIWRLFAPLELGGAVYSVKLTVKEYAHPPGSGFYTHQLEEIEMPAGQLEEDTAARPTPSHTGTVNVAQVVPGVNATLGDRQHGEKVLNSVDVTEGVKGGLQNLQYLLRTNESDAAFAARIMAQVGGPEAAIPVFTDSQYGLPSATRSMLGMEIVKALSAASRLASASANADEAARLDAVAARFLDDAMLPYTTELAQGLQALSAWYHLTPEGKLVWAQRQVTKAASDALSAVRPEIDQAAAELAQINAQGAEQAARSDAVQAAAAAAVDAAIQAQAGQAGTELRRVVAGQAADTATRIPELDRFDVSIRELVRRHYTAPDQVTLASRLAERLGLSPAESLTLARKVDAAYADAVARLKARIKRQAATVRRDPLVLRAARAGIVDLAHLPDAELTLALARAMQDTRVKLGKLVREHWSKVNVAGQSLADALAAKAGIPKAESEQLAQALQRQFDRLVTARKEAILQQLLRPARARGIIRPGLIDRLVQLSNLGAFSQEQYWQAVQQRLSLPQWTPEVASQVRQQVDDIQTIPEDQVERRQKATVRLLNTIERAKGITPTDLGIAFYVTNLLTGPTTHMANMLSTSLQAAGSAAVEIERVVAGGRPGDALLILEALGAGIRQGWRSARDVMRTGVVTGTRLKKIEPGRALEIASFGTPGGVPIQGAGAGARALRWAMESRLARVLNLWKFNFRAMAGEDLLLFRPLEEVKAAMLAAQLARRQGLTGVAARAEARRVLGYGAQQAARAMARAKAEGLSGADARRRQAEILQGQRPKEITETAAEYARRNTFNSEPYGLMGRIAQMLNRAKSSEDPKLRVAANLVVPFTNIVSNVVNEGLNWGPIGAYRAWRNSDTMLGIPAADLTPAQKADLRAELMAKAFTGTAMLSVIAMWAATQIDDEEPAFAIYGSGPQNPSDRRGLEAAGWLPHSVRIGQSYFSYAYTPLAVWMAILGNMMDQHRDAHRYGNRDVQRMMSSLPDRIASAAVQGARVVTEQSFLQGLLDLASVISSDQASAGSARALRIGARAAVGTVVPNLVAQIDRTMDPVRRQGRDAAGILVGAVPFVRRTNLPSLDALGREIRYAPLDRFGRPASVDPLIERLAERGLWPEMPDRNRIYPRKGRPMDEDEFYAYVRDSGRLVRDRLLRWRRRWDTADPERARQTVSEIVSDARAQVRAKMGF